MRTLVLLALICLSGCNKPDSEIVKLDIRWKFTGARSNQNWTIQLHRGDKNYNLQDVRDNDMNYVFRKGDYLSIDLGCNLYYFEFLINDSRNYEKTVLTPNMSNNAKIVICMDQFFR